MSDLFRHHLQRLESGASQATALSEVSKWISQNTFLNNKPYSYVDHEYQQRILDSEAREINCRKCSQVGISELSIRRSLALCGMLNNFTVAYTLPTSGFAATVSKTRVSPVIQDSPYLKALLKDTDNVEVKQFTNGSFLFLRGSASSNSPISIPVDALVHDELDFSDAHTVSMYTSRLTHSRYKMKFRLSTPTIPGKGIDYEFQRSRRFFNFVKCDHCGHHFVPDYYLHTKIPGYSGELLDINRRNLHSLQYTEAFIECPSCGKEPDLGPEHREWVCENPSDNFVAEGFQVSPFDAPRIITPGYLVEASTSYPSDIGQFVNFNLGLPYYSQESVLSPEEIRGVITNEAYVGSAAYVMGIDLGKVCHICVAASSWDGSMQVVHLEEVPLQRLRERYIELRAKYRVRVSVIDSLPYTDVVLALQSIDQNLWASVYTNMRGPELFTVKKREEKDEEGLQQLRQINVARDKTFDALMAFIRSGQFSKVTDQNDDLFVTHCTDMRRMKDWDARAQEMVFRWVKSEQGDDHYWFATSYAFLAKHICGTFTGSGGGGLPLLSTFRVLPKK